MAKSCDSPILVVEDEPNDRALIEMALRENGVAHSIRLLENAHEAIDYLMGEGKYADRAEYPYPSFILTDLGMPNGDGFALLEHLKANPTWAVIPTVVLSASADPDDVKRAYLLGASAFHVKPHGYLGLRHQLKLLYDYWVTSVTPEREAGGRWLETESAGKLGARFGPEPNGVQRRVKVKCEVRSAKSEARAKSQLQVP